MNYTRSLISCIKNSRACFIGAKDSRLRLESLSADKTRSFVLYTLHKDYKNLAECVLISTEYYKYKYKNPNTHCKECFKVLIKKNE